MGLSGENPFRTAIFAGSPARADAVDGRDRFPAEPGGGRRRENRDSHGASIPPRRGGASGAIERASPDITLLPVTQATRATFAGLYLERTLLVFIRTGSKRVECPISGELVGQAGDVMIFPPGSMVTMENRPLVNDSYRADALSLSHALVGAVFAGPSAPPGPIGVQVLGGAAHRPGAVFDLVRDTLEACADLPEAIFRHRLLEPLVWLQESGVRLTVGGEDHPLAKVRRLVETDLSHSWRVPEAAAHFGMSEATFRRWLARSGLGFSGILSNCRLEQGLGLLQTTLDPISQIALECGFKTPSHFSDAFRARFGITPRQIRSAAT